MNSCTNAISTEHDFTMQVRLHYIVTRKWVKCKNILYTCNIKQPDSPVIKPHCLCCNSVQSTRKLKIHISAFNKYRHAIRICVYLQCLEMYSYTDFVCSFICTEAADTMQAIDPQCNVVSQWHTMQCKPTHKTMPENYSSLLNAWKSSLRRLKTLHFIHIYNTDIFTLLFYTIVILGISLKIESNHSVLQQYT